MLHSACSVVNTLREYAIKAVVNTVDHLGSVSFKVTGLLEAKVDEVSGAESRVSCIEQVRIHSPSQQFSLRDIIVFCNLRGFEPAENSWTAKGCRNSRW